MVGTALVLDRALGRGPQAGRGELLELRVVVDERQRRGGERLRVVGGIRQFSPGRQ